MQQKIHPNTPRTPQQYGSNGDGLTYEPTQVRGYKGNTAAAEAVFCLLF